MRVQFVNMIIAKIIEQQLNSFLKERRRKKNALVLESYSRVSKVEMRDEMALKYFLMRSLEFKISILL